MTVVTTEKIKEPIILSSKETALKDLLINLLYFHTWSGNEQIMNRYLNKKLRSLGFKTNTDKAGNMYAQRGTAPYVLLNAHMDIIHDLSWQFKQTLKKDKTNNTTEIKSSKSTGIYGKCAYCQWLDYCASTYETKTGIEYEMCVAQFLGNYETCKAYARATTDEETLLNKIIIADCEEYLQQTNKAQLTNIRWRDDYEDDYIIGNRKTYTYSYKSLTDSEKHEADEILNEKFEVLYNKYTGVIKGSGERVLGGDDKCGIALALHLAEYNQDIPMKILFTTDEEVGCVGVKEFIKSHENWFDDVMYCLTLDDRGDDNLLRWMSGGAK